MRGFDNDTNPLGLKNIIECFGNLSRHFFLNLKPFAIGVYQPREFAYTHNPPVWQICNMGLTYNVCKMMLAV